MKSRVITEVNVAPRRTELQGRAIPARGPFGSVNGPIVAHARLVVRHLSIVLVEAPITHQALGYRIGGQPQDVVNHVEPGQIVFFAGVQQLQVLRGSHGRAPSLIVQLSRSIHVLEVLLGSPGNSFRSRVHSPLCLLDLQPESSGIADVIYPFAVAFPGDGVYYAINGWIGKVHIACQASWVGEGDRGRGARDLREGGSVRARRRPTPRRPVRR